MHTPLVIVDGKTSFGKRISVSIDEALWTLFIASRAFNSARARHDLRRKMQEDVINNTYTARCWIYRQIADPRLLGEAEPAAREPRRTNPQPVS